MKEPNLVIPRMTYDQIVEYCRLAKNREISGLGKCEYDPKTNTYTVVHAEVLKQEEQTGGSTVITAEAIGKYMFDTKDIGQILWWWHSHVDMAAFWSGTDDACIESFGKEGGVVATVFNKRGEHLSAVRLKANVPILGDIPLRFDKVPTQIVSYYMPDVWEKWAADVKAAEVEPPKYEPRHYTGADKPPKHLTKQWEKIPNKENFIFEEPRKGAPDWCWSIHLNDWREPYSSEYHKLDLLEHPVKQSYKEYLEKKQLERPANLAQVEAQKSLIDTLDADEGAPSINDAQASEDEQVRLFHDYSDEEWKLITPYEKDMLVRTGMRRMYGLDDADDYGHYGGL